MVSSSPTPKRQLPKEANRRRTNPPRLVPQFTIEEDLAESFSSTNAGAGASAASGNPPGPGEEEKEEGAADEAFLSRKNLQINIESAGEGTGVGSSTHKQRPMNSGSSAATRQRMTPHDSHTMTTSATSQQQKDFSFSPKLRLGGEELSVPEGGRVGSLGAQTIPEHKYEDCSSNGESERSASREEEGIRAAEVMQLDVIG